MSKEKIEYKETVRENTEKYFNYAVIYSILTFILFTSAVWFGSNIFMYSMTVVPTVSLVLLVVGTCVSFAIFDSNMRYFALYRAELNSLN